MSAEAEVGRLRSAIATLHAKIADQASKASTANARSARARQGAAKSKVESGVASKLREAERLERAARDADKRRADLEQQMAARSKALARAESRLARERTTQNRVLSRLERDLSSLEGQFRPEFPASSRPTGIGARGDSDEARHDVFISHASEDKDDIARPLAELLRDRGLDVWFDELALTVGDSLRRRIDIGLRDSLFGVVILSPEFFRKGWTQAELDGLVARERAHGHKVILPVWHRVTKDDVLASSPTLADKVALNSSVMTLEQMADAISAVVRPEQPPQPVRIAAHELRNIVETHSDEVRKVVARHGGTAVAVFGSVARGDAEASSDIDLLVDFEEGRSLADLARIKAELAILLDHEVDVVSVGGLRARDGEIPADAVWL